MNKHFFGLIVLWGIILGPRKCNPFVEIRLGLAVRPKSVTRRNFAKFRENFWKSSKNGSKIYPIKFFFGPQFGSRQTVNLNHAEPKNSKWLVSYGKFKIQKFKSLFSIKFFPRVQILIFLHFSNHLSSLHNISENQVGRTKRLDFSPSRSGTNFQYVVGRRLRFLDLVKFSIRLRSIATLLGLCQIFNASSVDGSASGT